ncbi:DNA alkylation repair protein [Termitidicoccus mucosus]|uniref:DNA alkylation repair protein n=1 Tax=Termitidicoccus mucosus TaxID=1184151 RepID=A0A178IKD8_9BACT|nr:DNA alkylation repair protein [Opitutaceae bacterium TSB47]
MKSPIQQLRTRLKENADVATRESGKRFFKQHEAVKLHGVKTAMVLKIARTSFESVKSRSKEEVLALCDDLWESGYIEETFVACEWAYGMRKHYIPADLERFEKWLADYVDNWASCDTLCNHSVGTLVEMYPELLASLLRWTRSDNRWLKRGAAVSLIIPARKGLFFEAVFAIANRLLGDSDDLVQKGYGWLLKAASGAHAKEVFAYLMEKHAVMPRTAFRYALEKMPAAWRIEAMSK